MSQPRAAILLITGFSQPDYRDKGCGLWGLHDLIADAFPDRRDVWLRIRTWNSDGLEPDADEIAGVNPELIATVTYSWGNGYGLPKFANQLYAHARSVDCACLIDPVPYTMGRLISNALSRGSGPFHLPDNVMQFASWRTVNKPSWDTPWARDVEAAGRRPLDQVAFGSVENLNKYQPLGRYEIDGSVTHSNIDDDGRVHAGVLDVLKAILGSA